MPTAKQNLTYLAALSALCVFGSCMSRAADMLPITPGPPLSGTKPLTMTGDIASQMVDGIDRFLLREWDSAMARRERYWKYDPTSAEAFEKSIAPHRNRLAHILGVRDSRVPFESPELSATLKQSALLGHGPNFDIFAVRWPVFGDVHGEGVLLLPKGPVVANVVAIPDAQQTPEQLCGLVEGVPASSQFARRLAENGCRVIVPTLINRDIKARFPPERTNGAKVSNREFIYRSAFILGRHLLGYEVQKVLSCVDWFERDAASKPTTIGVAGYGEGGLIALYAAALDSRVDATLLSGSFGTQSTLWQQPLDRNVFGLLEQFGDAELASMLANRRLVVEANAYPIATLPGEGGAPGKLERPTAETVRSEFQRIPDVLKKRNSNAILVQGTPSESNTFCSGVALEQFATHLGIASLSKETKALQTITATVNDTERQNRQFHELDRHNQQLLSESSYVRASFMKKLETGSLEKYEKSVESYREHFRNETIGHFDLPLLPPKARSRRIYETPTWNGYEVVLDVWQDVFAYGVLMIPKNLKDGERRPVVVCQHGLEGRPVDTITGDHYAYHDYAAKLCERGFITFAPQNPYIFKDRFRTLQRKANPLKKSLFSIIVPQHQQIVNWLKTVPGVDDQRIAFYGLSYGGKSAMRIPALVNDYCLSICSADFNEWVAKNASTRLPFSYVWTGEYEIFEFDLGSTFNYAEMAALICPRPFMVERGHTDGVATDEWVAFEFAKVRNLYSHRLKIPQRCEMEVFDGPHTINGQGTFSFLHKHLNWPVR